jgi:hypothetical protein
MIEVPADTPLTVPVDGSTVALAVLLLLHVPPVIVLFKSLVAPTHALAVPVIEDGVVFTVTTLVTAVPQPVVYCMVAFPALTPVTTPVVETTVALAVF